MEAISKAASPQPNPLRLALAQIFSPSYQQLKPPALTCCPGKHPLQKVLGGHQGNYLLELTWHLHEPRLALEPFAAKPFLTSMPWLFTEVASCWRNATSCCCRNVTSWLPWGQGEPGSLASLMESQMLPA